jgi:hypothetical protein
VLEQAPAHPPALLTALLQSLVEDALEAAFITILEVGGAEAVACSRLNRRLWSKSQVLNAAFYNILLVIDLKFSESLSSAGLFDLGEFCPPQASNNSTLNG